MIELQNLSLNNIEDCLRLSVDYWQEKYCSSAAEAIARAYVEPERLVPLVISKESQKGIGFILVARDLQQKKAVVEELLVDRKFQSRHYGTWALEQLTGWLSEDVLLENIEATVAIGNQWARDLLEKRSFMRLYTDLEQKKEITYRYIIR